MAVHFRTIAKWRNSGTWRSSGFIISVVALVFLTTVTSAQQRNYAVIVGIAGYPHFTESSRLKYADADAKKFYDFIVSPQGGGFLAENVHLIRNGDATHERIAKEIEWLGAHSPIDRAYIFFAGHGVTDSKGLAYFLPWEGDPISPSATGFRTDRFLEDVRDTVTAETLVVFIDACHAASAFSSGRRGPENIAGAILHDWQAEFKQPQEQEIRMAFLAAASNESALEDDEFKQGLFTYYLLKGLSGEADEDNDGKVTALELRNYLDHKVTERAIQKFKARQDPTLSPGFFPDLTLSILGANNGASWKPKLSKPQSVQPSDVAFTHTYHFNHSEFPLTAVPEFGYGFSSLELFQDIKSKARVTKISVQLNVVTHTSLMCCDVWVLLGPDPFGFVGGPVRGTNPSILSVNNTVAPTQLRVVIGNGGAPYPIGPVTISATYNFESGIVEGFPKIDNFKGAFAPMMDLSTGLYAQVFVWNGNGYVNVDVKDITLVVEGVHQVVGTSIPVESSLPLTPANTTDIHEGLISDRLSMGWTITKRQNGWTLYCIMDTDQLNPALRAAIQRAEIGVEPNLSRGLESLWREIRQKVPSPKPLETEYGVVTGQEFVEHVTYLLAKDDTLQWTYEIMRNGSGVTPQPQVYKQIALGELSLASRETIGEINTLATRTAKRRYIDATVSISK